MSGYLHTKNEVNIQRGINMEIDTTRHRDLSRRPPEGIEPEPRQWGSAFDLPRSESFRMDETALTARSTLSSKESPSSLIFLFQNFFLQLFRPTRRRPNALRQWIPYGNGHKRFFAFAADLEGGCELKTIGASAASDGPRSDF